LENRLQRKYTAVIFDLFGTLVDNFTITEYQQILEEMSSILKAPPEGFSRLWRDTFRLRTNGTHRTHQESIRYICRELSVPVTEDQIEESAAVRLDYTIKSLKPRPEAVPVIKKLKTMGYRVGLISDCSPETPAAWSKTPFDGIFDVTVFSCVAGVKKPDPRIYQIATDSLKVKPEDCLYIGDGSSHELTGAKQAGMTPVLIRVPDEPTDTHFIEREENWEGPVIATLREVLELVS
jgi:putative hydrolase of the HAD superfamily